MAACRLDRMAQPRRRSSSLACRCECPRTWVQSGAAQGRCQARGKSGWQLAAERARCSQLPVSFEKPGTRAAQGRAVDTPGDARRTLHLDEVGMRLLAAKWIAALTL